MLSIEMFWRPEIYTQLYFVSLLLISKYFNLSIAHP